MKKILLTFITLAFVTFTQAQSLEVNFLDSIIGLNSYNGQQHDGYVKIKNISSTAKNVKVQKIVYNSNACAYDSTYFCWDLCYDSNADSSFGYQTIMPNAVNYAFSAYAYAKTDGSACVDSVGYKFFVAGNPNDYVMVRIKFQSSGTFSVTEVRSSKSNVYPNPANNFFYVELPTMPTSGTRLELYNLVGSKVLVMPLNQIRTEVSTANLPSGMYLFSIIANGKAIDTRKVTVKH
jgi:hypothetical protein